MNAINIKKPFTSDMCSCCGSKRCYKDIKTEYTWMGRVEIYEEMLYSTFDVTIYQDDQTDSAQTQPLICEDCVKRVRDACNFKKQVLECQQTIVDYHQNLQNNDSCVDTCMPVGALSEDEEQTETVVSQRYQKNRGQDYEMAPEKKDRMRKQKADTLKILKVTNMTPFRWHRSKYQCFCCKMFFDNICDVRKHMKNHSFEQITKEIDQKYIHHKVEVTSLKCTVCSKLLNFMELKNHLRAHKVKFYAEKNLLVPFLLENTIQCAVCGEKFTGFHALNVHMNEHYQNHICELCGQGFISETSLKNHKQRHKKIYKCHKCDLVFRTEHQRDYHSIKIHNNPVEKRVCPHCPDRFKTHYSRLLHMIKEHGHKKPEHKCPSCDKTFIRQFLVNAHVRKFHIKERNYECNVCSHKFFGLSDMNRHVQETHGGRKKFSCKFCSKSYSRTWTLNDHILKVHKA